MSVLNQVLKSGLLILLIIGLAKCTVKKETGKVITPPLTDSIAFIEVNDLVTNKSKYHGKWVETEAFCSFGFEKSELSYDSIMKTLDGSIRFRVHNAIWVEFISSHPYAKHVPDSVNNKYIRLRGYYDTTKKGHLEQYAAELTHTYYFKLLKNR